MFSIEVAYSKPRANESLDGSINFILFIIGFHNIKIDVIINKLPLGPTPLLNDKK